MTRSCLPCVLLGSALLAPPATGQAPDKQFSADTRQYLSRLEKLGFSGVLLIAANGEPVLAEGYGLADRERGIRWSPATVSTIGSITKQFTGAAILLLEERGLLSVEDPIAKYFEEVPEDKRAITLHHLLTHSSGIVDLAGLGDWDPIDRDEFVLRAMNQPLNFAPGSGYEYSNAGYSLLGAIIEQLTGSSYEQFVRERLFIPNGMYDTGYILPSWGEGRIAQGYRNGQRWGTVLGRPLGPDGPYWVLRANGGIHSTAHDMLRWAQALTGGRVLSEESMAKYWAPHVDEGGGSFYGYGWVNMEGPGGAKVITHNGGNGILFADMAIVPETKMVFFVQTNDISESQAANRLLEQVAIRLAAGRPYPDVPEVVAAEAAELERYEGDYEVAAGGLLHVAVDDDGLFVEPGDPRAFSLLHSTRALDSARVERLSKRIDEIVGGYLQGDFSGIYEAYRREVTVEYLRNGWEEMVRGLETRFGSLRGHTVVGTALRDEDITIVRFQFERGTSDRAYVWDPRAEERLLGVSRRGLEPRLRFLPVGEGEFASWDGGISPSRPLRFDRDGDELVIRIGEGNRTVEAALRR